MKKIKLYIASAIVAVAMIFGTFQTTKAQRYNITVWFLSCGNLISPKPLSDFEVMFYDVIEIYYERSICGNYSGQF